MCVTVTLKSKNNHINEHYLVTFLTFSLTQRPWKKREPWPAEAADAHYLAGLCHMELRNYSEALGQFNHAIKFNPSYSDVSS